MPATTAIGLRYPQTTDNNAVATDMQNLATDVDAILEASYTQAEITAFTAGQKWEHRRLFNSTKGCFQWYDVATTTWIDDYVMILPAAKTANYVAVQADSFGKAIPFNSASALQLQIPTNASVPFQIGSLITAYQYGAGQLSVVAVTPGTTTIRAPGGAVKTRTQYSTLNVLKINTDEWLVSGDIVT